MRVDIKMTYRCNNKCKFCVQGDKRDYHPDKTTREIEDALESSSKQGIDGVIFTGGEVTIREDILPLVRRAKSLGFKTIQIQTNGRMFAYEDFCKKAVLAGANQFSPAVHGHNEKIHDYLTSAKGSFKQTVQGIKNLKRLGQEVITNTVITKPNYKHLPEIARLLVGLGVDQFQFAFVHIIGTAEKNAKLVVPRKKDIMPYVKKGLDIGIKAGKRVMTEAIPYCFMQGYEQYIAEKIIPDTKVIEYSFVIDDYTTLRKKEGKTKSQKCKQCKHYAVCEGPWKEYPRLYGWDEFKPVA